MTPKALLLACLLSACLTMIAGHREARAREQTTSEGRPPIVCPLGALTIGLLCEGEFCDDVTMRCSDTIRDVRSLYWTQFVHRPDGAPRATCGDRFSSTGVRGFMSGIACAGEHCATVALQCTELEIFEPDWTTCSKSDWFSEEAQHAWQTWPSPADFVVALTCKGAYCDEKSVLTCRPKRRK